jgi:Flp pilus assembly pilin Flp
MGPRPLANDSCKECTECTRPTLAADWSGDESGQDLIEYALLAAVLSVALVGTTQAVGDGIMPFFDRVLAAFRSL